jgi:hypothetical protein
MELGFLSSAHLVGTVIMDGCVVTRGEVNSGVLDPICPEPAVVGDPLSIEEEGRR